ncbi:MAG: hypothetical protein J6V23_08535 [Bacteroidaceae bacterium]|nr:hypothetical protein [Bacteroidaceae bacterium]
MSVIINVDNKVEYILSLLDNSYTEDEFLAKFKEIYPRDYEKCRKKFIEEEMKTKKGKMHPMQHPDKHIKNALKSYICRKRNNNENI